MKNNNEYKILDVSDWKVEDEGKGYSESYWLINLETRQRGLFKRPKYNSHYDFYYGEHWAEKIVAEVGKKINLNMPDVDLAVYDHKKGCLSHIFLDKGESLKEGVEVLSVDVTKQIRDKYYLENILIDLEEYDLIEDFIDLLLFDGFIGQTDRHEENWGIIISKSNDKNMELALIYDNASSLGRNLLPDKINQIFQDDHYFNSYIEGCKSCIKLKNNSNPTQFDVVNFIYRNYNDFYMNFIKELEKLKEDEIRKIVNKTPKDFMSLKQKKLVVKILLERKNRLLSIIE